MRTRFSTKTKNRKEIEHIVRVVFEKLNQDEKIKDLKKVDYSNSYAISKICSWYYTVFDQVNETSGLDATNIYKEFVKRYFHAFGNFKMQWILLLFFVQNVDFQNEETVKLIFEHMDRFARNSELTSNERIKLMYEREKNLDRSQIDYTHDFYKEVLKEDEYIILYRGFHSHDEENIRSSNDKNLTKKYYKQKGGSGYSFTTSKDTAFMFSTFLFNENLVSSLGMELHGRFCMARYIAKRSNIFCVSNNRDEREVLINANKVFLLDYKFLSNKEFATGKSAGTSFRGSLITDNIKTIEKLRSKDKNHWLNRFWTSNKVTIRDKKLRELLENS